MNIDAVVRLYAEDGLTAGAIGERFGIPERTIHRYLVKAGAPMRKRTDPKHTKLADREWLEEQYFWLGKSTPQIAAEQGCQSRTVLWWLNRHGILTRTPGSEKGHKRMTEEARQKLSQARYGKYRGPESWAWKGGVAKRDRDRSSKRAVSWARAIKDRDGWRCTECGATENLHAHHLKPWKSFPELRYEMSNGVTLCKRCHERAHGQRFAYRVRKYAKRPTSASAPAAG